MVVPEFLILFREGSWHIECGNQLFGSYETLVSATAAAVKARFNLSHLPTRVLVEGIDGKHKTVWDPEEPDVYEFRTTSKLHLLCAMAGECSARLVHNSMAEGLCARSFP
jgi:hypothetical protein